MFLEKNLVNHELWNGRYSVVCIATVCWFDGSWFELRWGEIFASVQTDPDAHPASCTGGTGSSVPGSEAAVAWRWPPPPI